MKFVNQSMTGTPINKFLHAHQSFATDICPPFAQNIVFTWQLIVPA